MENKISLALKYNTFWAVLFLMSLAGIAIIVTSDVLRMIINNQPHKVTNEVTIDCTNIDENTEYTLTSTLYDKKTNDILRDKDGNEVKAVKKFYAKDLDIYETKDTSGSINTDFITNIEPYIPIISGDTKVRKMTTIKVEFDISNVDLNY